MGHKQRSTKSSFKKDISPMRGCVANKASIPEPVARKFSTAAAVSSESDKWKWNNLVKDNRESFNNMHFC